MLRMGSLWRLASRWPHSPRWLAAPPSALANGRPTPRFSYSFTTLAFIHRTRLPHQTEPFTTG